MNIFLMKEKRFGRSWIMGLFFIVLFVLCQATADEELAPEIIEHPASIVVRLNEPATLNCVASNAKSIIWFKDAEELVTSSQDMRSHRVLLPSGALYFLHVASSKKDSDAGTYWCVVSNSNGAARSENATLTIAFLLYEFESYPQALLKVRIGDSVNLICKPPKGSPPPALSWVRNGQVITNSSRITVTSSGEVLTITKAALEDTASYLCRAQNLAGIREAPPTELIIMIPPWFEEKPVNLTTASGVSVELTCRAQGSPTPTVKWRKLDGVMPYGAIIDIQHLILSHVIAADTGVYACEVHNEAGYAVAKSLIIVYDVPKLIQQPQDLKVLAGEAAQLSCLVESEPPSILLWKLPTLDRNTLLIAYQKSGHVSISQDGQILHFSSISTRDSGSYYCWGISRGGGVSAKAEVIVVRAYPPPVIGIGPKDMILSPGSNAMFPCEAVSEYGVPSITWWYSPAAQLPKYQLQQTPEKGRLSITASGALRIKDVKSSDAGIYTCRITADTGHAEKEAVLRISDRVLGSLPIYPPAPPSKPQILFINESTIYLKWLPNSKVYNESKLWYRVEYWRRGWKEWRVADSIMYGESCIVKNLLSGNIYTFLVRAVNIAGASFPSPWSDPVTVRSPRDSSLTLDQIQHVRRRLSRSVAAITNVSASGPSNALLEWKYITTEHETLEGVLVYYIFEDRVVKVATVLGHLSSHQLYNLQPNALYTFFLVPFWRSIEGTPSNSLSLVTPEDVPEVGPSNVAAKYREDGSTLITWSTLSAKDARGNVIGYEVVLTHNGTEATEVVTSPWLEAHGLIPGRIYLVQVAAKTGAGLGPFSSPVLVDFNFRKKQDHRHPVNESSHDSSGTSVPSHHDWLIYLLIPLALLLIVAAVFYIRHLHHQYLVLNHTAMPDRNEDSNACLDCNLVSMYGEEKLKHLKKYSKEHRPSFGKLWHSDRQMNEYAEPKTRGSEMTKSFASATHVTHASPYMTSNNPQEKNNENTGALRRWSDFLPQLPTLTPPCEIGLSDPSRQTISLGECRKYSGSFLHGSNILSGPRKSSFDNVSEHNYDVPLQIAPNDYQENRRH